jgi:hypothetical protein
MLKRMSNFNGQPFQCATRKPQRLRLTAIEALVANQSCCALSLESSERFNDAKKQTTRVEANASACTFNSYPVGRAVQAAVCKTAEAGAIPARDSISSGISAERYTPVFQTGIVGALPTCPSIS